MTNIYNELCFNSFFSLHERYVPLVPRPSTFFLTWFIGLNENRHSFVVNKRGDLVFNTILKTADIAVLYYIKETLGFGKVIRISSFYSKYITQEKKEIAMIIHIFNGNTILPSTNKMIVSYTESFNIWASKGKVKLEPVLIKKELKTPSLHDNWLAGYTDLNGYFSCEINPKGHDISYSIVENNIKNMVVLENISRLFESGSVEAKNIGCVYNYSGPDAYRVLPLYFDNHPLHTDKLISYLHFKCVCWVLNDKNRLDWKETLAYKLRVMNILKDLQVKNKEKKPRFNV